MKYCETRNLPPFNWLEYLTNVKYSDGGFHVMAQLAGNWPTCAVGNQCAIIPRMKKDNENPYYGRPYDTQLYDLGIAFSQRISGMTAWHTVPSLFEKYRLQALQIFHDIEVRAAKVIEEELAKQNIV